MDYQDFRKDFYIEAPEIRAMTAEAVMELARSSGVRAALHSALSKFDSLDAFFAAGEKPPAVAKRVFEEMRPDLDALGLDAKALHAAKGQAVAHVGKACVLQMLIMLFCFSKHLH